MATALLTTFLVLGCVVAAFFIIGTSINMGKGFVTKKHDPAQPAINVVALTVLAACILGLAFT